MNLRLLVGRLAKISTVHSLIFLLCTCVSHSMYVVVWTYSFIRQNEMEKEPMGSSSQSRAQPSACERFLSFLSFFFKFLRSIPSSNWRWTATRRSSIVTHTMYFVIVSQIELCWSRLFSTLSWSLIYYGFDVVKLSI